jgi:CBS domain containing-hemolysin-like protein
MSEPWSAGAVAAGLAGAGVLFLLDLALSVMLLSLTSLSRVALRRLSQESGGRLKFLEDIKTIASIHRSAVHTVRQTSLLGGIALVAWTVDGAGVPYAGAAAALVGAFVGIFLMETFVARLIALRDPRAAVRATAVLVRPVYAVTYPVLAPIHAAFRRWAGEVEDEERGDDEADEEVEAFIEVGEREGILEPAEGEMVRGIVDLDETRVREIMTPRTDLVALAADAPVSEARRVALREGHSRFPVYQGTIDNIVGVLHVRDLLRAWEEGWDDAPVSGFARPAVFVPETRTVAELLAEMRAGSHLALVVDEYGGLAGLVTIEDLLEEIVGDIRDEHDDVEADVQPQPDGSALVSGLAHVEELESAFHVEFGEREFDTVGGLVTATLGRVPEAGESLEAHGLRIEVLEADPRRVFRVRVRAAGAPAPPGGAR